MVDLGALTKVVPLLVSQKLGVQPQKCDTYIVHLDRSNVTMLGILPIILIGLASNPKFSMPSTFF